MNIYNLPKSTNIDGVDCTFNSDFRNILYIFKILNDSDLLDSEKIELALENFYDTKNYIINYVKAYEEFCFFINVGKENNKTNKKPLYDWEQDFNIIISPINKTLGYDVRGIDYLHWWTFMSAFMEIGESTFSTFVGIRDKKNRGKKLENYEEKIFRENRDNIVLKKKYDSVTQAYLDEIMN